MAACPDRPELPRSASQLQALLDAGVPAVDLPDPCRECESACSGLEGYGPSFEVDYDSKMLGSCNPFQRLVVCSTQGLSDWPRAVTEEEDSLAFNIHSAYQKIESRPGLANRLSSKLTAKIRKSPENPLAGLHPSSRFQTAEERDKSITILNGSHWSAGQEQSVLVFPDYKILHGVANTRATTEALAQYGLSKNAEADGAIPGSTIHSYVLPYRCVILVCSHKRRDKRCSIAAPLLIDEIKRACEDEGWHVDEHLDEKPSINSLEDFLADDEKRAQEYENGLRMAAAEETVAVVKVSHIGGHRYSGNVICCFPSGASVWYGRTTPREIESIVRLTIGEGKVINELLRGGIGLTNGHNNVLAW